MHISCEWLWLHLPCLCRVICGLKYIYWRRVTAHRKKAGMGHFPYIAVNELVLLLLCFRGVVFYLVWKEIIWREGDLPSEMWHQTICLHFLRNGKIDHSHGGGISVDIVTSAHPSFWWNRKESKVTLFSSVSVTSHRYFFFIVVIVKSDLFLNWQTFPWRKARIKPFLLFLPLKVRSGMGLKLLPIKYR